MTTTHKPNESVTDARAPNTRIAHNRGDIIYLCKDCGKICRYWNVLNQSLAEIQCECHNKTYYAKPKDTAANTRRARLRYQLRRERMG